MSYITPAPVARKPWPHSAEEHERAHAWMHAAERERKAPRQDDKAYLDERLSPPDCELPSLPVAACLTSRGICGPPGGGAA